MVHRGVQYCVRVIHIVKVRVSLGCVRDVACRVSPCALMLRPWVLLGSERDPLLGRLALGVLIELN